MLFLLPLYDTCIFKNENDHCRDIDFPCINMKQMFTTVFVDTRLWKTKHPFPKFLSVLPVIDRLDWNPQLQPLVWPSNLLYIMQLVFPVRIELNKDHYLCRYLQYVLCFFVCVASMISVYRDVMAIKSTFWFFFFGCGMSVWSSWYKESNLRLSLTNTPFFTKYFTYIFLQMVTFHLFGLSTACLLLTLSFQHVYR